MTEDERKNHEYLGDGVYIELRPEAIILRTGDHRDTHCENIIYLEPNVLGNMIAWLTHKNVITDNFNASKNN